MKKYLFIVLLVGVCFGQKSPCEDSRYVKLKEKSLDDMSDREYKYFMEIDKNCREFSKNSQNSESEFSIENPPYILYVETNPSNSSLYINGEYIGQSPKKITLSNSEVTIKITNESEQYNPEYDRLILNEGYNKKRYVLSRNKEYYKNYTWWDYNGGYFLIGLVAVFLGIAFSPMFIGI